jgi:hypothetical protein
LVVLAFLDDVFVFEERDDGGERGDGALTETGDWKTGTVGKMRRKASVNTYRSAT